MWRPSTSGFPSAKFLVGFLAFLVLLIALFLLKPRQAAADHHLVRIQEVMAGLNGDSQVQYVVLETADDSQKAWGPQPEDGVEAPGRAMLVFHRADGTETGRFVFPGNPAPGAETVLVATAAFAALPGAPTPDFIMPPELIPIAGKVAFRNNPDNANSTGVNVALAYGGTGYTGDTGGATDGPNPAQLPILNTVALTRVSGSGFGNGAQTNADFAPGPPNPSNTAGDTFAAPPAVASLADQGERLFNQESFLGNGRTCGSCHVPDNGDFGLSPEQILNKPADDVLFVAEYNVNTLVVTSAAPSGFAQPSDLRGEITGTTGSATVLAGTGDTYLIYGGDDLSGTISDAFGNSAQFVSFTFGDLGGPNPVNGSANGLENFDLMHGPSANTVSFPDGRALILENIDGFDQLEVFRASPALFNLEHTAPYGFSSEIPDLGEFSQGAITQHAPRSLLRREGIDFRPATEAELEALEAFQFTIRLPADGNYDLDRCGRSSLARPPNAPAATRVRFWLPPTAPCAALPRGRTGPSTPAPTKLQSMPPTACRRNCRMKTESAPAPTARRGCLALILPVPSSTTTPASICAGRSPSTPGLSSRRRRLSGWWGVPRWWPGRRMPNGSWISWKR